MPPPAKDKKQGNQPTTKKRRRYHSPLRQQQTAETRERIITAGVELVHKLPSWDWKNLSARAVGERAGVSERTVHRHFSTERKLRDTVLQRLVEESGIDMEQMRLGEFAQTVGALFRYMQSFTAGGNTPPLDPALESMDQQRIHALRQAVVRATPDWPDRKRETAAAILDIFWQPQIYDRFTLIWGFDAERAIDTITWIIDLIEEAVCQDRLPKSAS